MSVAGEQAVDQAQNVGGVVSAARKRERWQRLEANATDGETREQYREAISDLEARFPDLEEVGVGQAESFARARGHGGGSRSPVHEGRHRPRRPSEQPSPKTPPAAQGNPKDIPGLTPGATRTRARRSSSRRAALPSISLPRGGGLFSYVVLGIAGLSLLFVVLRSTETPGTPAKAVPSVINGGVSFLNRFLSLSDIFPATGAPAAYNETPGSPIATAAARLHAAEIAHPIRHQSVPRSNGRTPRQEAIHNIAG